MLLGRDSGLVVRPLVLYSDKHEFESCCLQKCYERKLPSIKQGPPWSQHCKLLYSFQTKVTTTVGLKLTKDSFILPPFGTILKRQLFTTEVQSNLDSNHKRQPTRANSPWQEPRWAVPRFEHRWPTGSVRGFQRSRWRQSRRPLSRCWT